MRAMHLVLMIILFAGSAWAGDTGSEFLKLCDEDDPWHDGYCVGYITGAGELLDGLLLEDEVRAAFEGKVFCLPDGVTKGTVRDRVLDYLRDRPDIGDRQMTSITWAALIEIYPCS